MTEKELAIFKISVNRQINEYPRLTRSCTTYNCNGRQYLRTAHKGVRGTWKCPKCRVVRQADTEDPKVREFLGMEY